MSNILLGTLIIVFGLELFFRPKWYSVKYSYYFDFTGYNYLFGSICILWGVLFLWIGIRKRKKKRAGKGEEER
jgi:uncharacterized membrane protein HdeD (DUF308 family)